MQRIFAPLMFVAVLFVFLSFEMGPKTASAAQIPFSRTLSVGSTGEDVRELQKIMNADPITAIASTGPGSKGQETAYFGLLTKKAVIRFQEKYAQNILVPNGLLQGTGIVGPSTRVVLASLSEQPLAVPASITPPSTASNEPSPTPPLRQPDSSNPNLKNLDIFLAAVDTAATKRNIPSGELAAIKKQIMSDIATTTDLQATFLKIVENSSKQASDESSVGGFFASITNALTGFWKAEHARAATGVPFGGALLYPFYCTQSQTWLITITPLPPSFAVLLTYVPFSQAFLSYNIPATSWLLGEYMPGAGVCIAGACPYCVSIPSEGMITPVVGSSPI